MKTDSLYQSKSEIVYRAVKEKIEAGQLMPGDRFSAKEMAEELGVSRTPVNDAMKKMAEYGLIEILPHVGYEVRALSWKEIRDIMRIEGHLEREAISWNNQAPDPEVIADLRRISGLIQEALQERDRKQYNELTNLFHKRFMDLSGSRVLKDIFLKSRHYAGWDDAKMIAMTDELMAINQEHDRILTVIEKRQIEEARRLMDEHSDHCERLIYQGLKEQGYPGLTGVEPTFTDPER